ncbi:hypothetical protein [Shewanella sp. KX20019]|uniref:hypothetical protein n=1 Tax=Shewanella sp. KX20019 TaxID=2803864 RepID=UPI001F477A32|nr:hypothetical protein [Shewanella sp. KX20019]
MLVLSYLAFGYFGGVNQVGQRSIQVEHNRLLNVLGVIRSQWQIQGKPERLQLDWRSDLTDSAETISYVSMATGGWPIPDETSVAGCRELIGELLGLSYAKQVVTKFNSNTGACRYIGEEGGSISYQTSSGRVIFLTGLGK